jgi:hypothetical protein
MNTKLEMYFGPCASSILHETGEETKCSLERLHWGKHKNHETGLSWK